MSSVNQVIFHSQSVLAPGVLFPNMSGGVVVQMMMSHTTHHVTELMVQYAGLTWRVVQQYCEVMPPSVAETLAVAVCLNTKGVRFVQISVQVHAGTAAPSSFRVNYRVFA